MFIWLKNTKTPQCTYFIYPTGSENNSLYLYYKGLSKTLLTFKFDTVKSVLDKDKKEDDTNEFVSAVCWRALPDGVWFNLISFTYDMINHSSETSSRTKTSMGAHGDSRTELLGTLSKE